MSSNLIVNNIEVGAGATVYTAASNALTFGTNGSEKVRITSGGSVNIGGDYTQTAKKFKVTGNSTFDGGIYFTGTLEGSGFSVSSGNVIIPAKIAHDGDSNTEFGFPANDTFAVETAGSERLRITSAGKVGIGTDNPSQKVSIANGRVNIDVKNDHYGVWADGDTTGENHISVGRWYNTGGGLKSGYTAYGINNLILENNHPTASHSLIIQPNGQKVAIGTHLVDGLVHIGQYSAGSVNADADADELVLESSDKTGMSILSPGSGESSIYFGNPGTNGQKEAWLKYYHETHSNTAKRRALQIKAGGGEVAYFNSTGLVMSNDKGISFINADDTASGETVGGSVLDDYEYGTWVPTYTSSNATFAYSLQQGWYIKVGKLVTVRAHITTSSVSSTSHSLLKMSGLPFQVAYRTPCSIRAYGFQGSGYDQFPTVATFEHNQTYLEFLRYTSGGTSDYTTSTMNNVTNIIIAGSYKVD